MDEVTQASNDNTGDVTNDPINHPSYYTCYKVEVIDLIEGMPFCRGAAIKYIVRAGKKDPAKEVEDLKKARWMIDREIARVSGI
ncbi:MAG: DUF3310 domain-containing protein [Rectinema sp.]